MDQRAEKLPRNLTARDWLYLLLSLTTLTLGLAIPAYRWISVHVRFLHAITEPKSYTATFGRPAQEALAWQRHLGAVLHQPRISLDQGGILAIAYACHNSAHCSQALRAYHRAHPATPFNLGYPYYLLVLLLSALPLAFVKGFATPQTALPAKGKLLGAKELADLARTRSRFPAYLSSPKDEEASDATFLGLLPEEDPRQVLRGEPTRYRYLQLPGEVRERHILVVAGTGAGKTTTYAYNQIASSAEKGLGVIIIDQKWGDETGLIGAIPIFLYHRRPVYVFTPFSPDSLRLPLLEGIPTDTPTGAMELAQMVIPAADDASIQHYRENDWALLAALVIAEIEHAKGEGRPPDLGHIVELLSLESKENLQTYTEISPIASLLARKIFARPSFKLDEAIPGLRNKLLPFLNPHVRRATTRGEPEENLDLNRILQEPALFYVGIPQTQVKMEDGKVLLRILKHYIDRAIFRQSRLPVPYNFILDEFANFGYLPNMAENLALIRSKRVAMHIILQSVEQAENVYGKEGWKAIATNNVNTEIWYVADLSPEVQLELEEHLGYTVAYHETYAERRQSPLDIIPTRTYGIRAAKEALISKEEMSKAPPGTVVARLPNVGWTLYRAIPLFDPRNPYHRTWKEALSLLPHFVAASRVRRQSIRQKEPPKPKPIPAGPQTRVQAWLRELLRMGAPFRTRRDPQGRINRIDILELYPHSVPPEWISEKLLKPTREGHMTLDAKALEAAKPLLPEILKAEALATAVRTAWHRAQILPLREDTVGSRRVAYLDLPSRTLYVPPNLKELYEKATPVEHQPRLLPEGEWRSLPLGDLMQGLLVYQPDGERTMALLYAQSFTLREPIVA